MRRIGVGTVADMLFLALLVSLSCFVLIQATPTESQVASEAYARRKAQNFLLSLQKLPVNKLGNFSFTPSLPVFVPARTRSLESKTLTQLIKEEVLLNPEWGRGEESDEGGDGSGLGRRLENVLRRALENLVGRKFGYRLTIRLEPVRLSGGRILSYERVIRGFEQGSKKICTETARLTFSIPRRWLSSDAREPEYFGRYGDLIIILGLWSG